MCVTTRFALGPGVTFCFTSGRAIFLDLIADRYLCLAQPEGLAFEQLVNGAELSRTQSAQLEALVERGLLTHRDQDDRPAPCPAHLPKEAVCGLIETAPSAIAQLRFAWHVMSARRRLKRYGLYKTVRAMRLRCDRANAFEEPPLHKLREATVLLAHIGRYMTRYDQCLPISLGLASYLQRDAVACSVVMGVQLGPFQAHCWVQRGDLLVGDDLDIVRTFTPILVV